MTASSNRGHVDAGAALLLHEVGSDARVQRVEGAALVPLPNESDRGVRQREGDEDAHPGPAVVDETVDGETDRERPQQLEEFSPTTSE